MRTRINCNSFLNTVRRFLPNGREKRKKAHISSEKQVNFLEKKKCQIEKLLDNAKYCQKKSEKKKRKLASEIKKLKKPVKHNTFGLRETMLCLRQCKLDREQRTLNLLDASIKRLETAKEEMENNPQEFLKKNGMLNGC